MRRFLNIASFILGVSNMFYGAFAVSVIVKNGFTWGDLIFAVIHFTLVFAMILVHLDTRE